MRVKRSISRRPDVAPRVVARRLPDSTTSVVPSQWPRAAPMYVRTEEDKSGAGCGDGVERDDARIVNELIRMATSPGLWMMRMFAL